MDLFVINRYTDSNEDVDIAEQESKHLEKLKQRIEERKRAYSTINNAPETDVTTPKETNLDKENENTIDETVNINNKHISEVSEPKPRKVNKDTTHHEFKVLGINEFEKKSKVSRVLPHWLSNPYSVSTDLQNLDSKIEEQNWLHSTLKATLLNEGVTHLFPVQKEVVPFILMEHKMSYPLQPHDICVSAPTGSGKTLSFVLPIIQILMDDIGCQTRALVVLPVQELAAQVAKVFKKYCSRTNLKVALLGGSKPLYQEQSIIVKYTESSGWVSEADIIVCTAGRLVEHLQNTEGFSLKHLKFLVIDEADRIMDHIQNDWLYHVEKNIKLGTELMTGRVPNLTWQNLSEQRLPPQKLLFSATLSQDPEKLEQWGLFQPKLFSAAPVNNFDDEDQIRLYATPAELKEYYVATEAENKPLVLYYFLIDQKWDKVLCFINSAESGHRLAVLLNTWGKGELRVAELSAALDKSTRESVLKKFTNSEINVLISTDALARGIDVPDCNYVISYDPPRNIKTYIHRVGRTSRAGRSGHAITLLLPNQLSVFKNILRSGGKTEIPSIEIPTSTLNNFHDSYANAMHETKSLIESEISAKVKKSVELKRRFKMSKSQK